MGQGGMVTEDVTGEMMKIIPIGFPSRAEDPGHGELGLDQEEETDHHLAVELDPDLAEETALGPEEEAAPGLEEEMLKDLLTKRKEAQQILLSSRNFCNLHKGAVEEV